MSVPLLSISQHTWSYSSCEPSTQCKAAGRVSSAIFSTQRSRWSFLLRGTAGLRESMAGRFPPALFSPIGVSMVKDFAERHSMRRRGIAARTEVWREASTGTSSDVERLFCGSQAAVENSGSLSAQQGKSLRTWFDGPRRGAVLDCKHGRSEER